MSNPPIAEVYRKNAAHEQECADTSSLPNARERHQRAAAKWLSLAEQSEKVSVGRG